MAIENKVITVESLKEVHDYNKNTYMTKLDPAGTGSLSIGRAADTDIGTSSSAVGYNLRASGAYSHAEGKDNWAAGNAAHVEGIGTYAGNAGAHAEGFETDASGNISHAEGHHTTASGEASHAEGYETIAASQYQHVQGQYNIEDTSDIYAHIVGNGTSDSARSNAHTLDWDGNAWFAGDFSADGNMILTSNQYGDELPDVGNVGRIFFKRLVE